MRTRFLPGSGFRVPGLPAGRFRRFLPPSTGYNKAEPSIRKGSSRGAAQGHWRVGHERRHLSEQALDTYHVILCGHPLGDPWGCIISDFRFQISDFRFQIADFRFQISDCRFQISDFRFQIADFRLSYPSHATKEENRSSVPMYIGTEVAENAEKIKTKSSIYLLSAPSA